MARINFDWSGKFFCIVHEHRVLLGVLLSIGIAPKKCVSEIISLVHAHTTNEASTKWKLFMLTESAASIQVSLEQSLHHGGVRIAIAELTENYLLTGATASVPVSVVARRSTLKRNE